MEVKKVLLVGNYGAGNIGDDLLLDASCAGLKKVLPDAEITVMAPGGDVALPPAGFGSLLRLSWLKGLKAIKNTDVVVFGGGGLLNAEVPYSVLIWGNVIRLARRYGKQVIMLGQSFSERKSGSVRKLLSKVDFFTVRDSVSERVVKGLGVETPFQTCSDLVFSLDSADLPVNDMEFDHENFVVLNICYYRTLHRNLQKEVLGMILNIFLKETPYAVYLLPFSRRDVEFMRELAADFADNGKVVVLPFDKGACLGALKQSRAVISSRLHPIIVAMLLNKPFLSLSYNSKSVGLLEDANMMDWNFDLRGKEALSSTDYLREHVYELINYADDEISPFDASLVEKFRNKSKRNFALLKSFLMD